MPYCFVLSCADGTYYAGSGMLLRSEVFKHMVGIGAPYTRDRRPLSLSWSEHHEDLEDAILRAREIGSWPREQVEGLMMGAYLRPRSVPRLVAPGRTNSRDTPCATGCLRTAEGQGETADP